MNKSASQKKREKKINEISKGTVQNLSDSDSQIKTSHCQLLPIGFYFWVVTQTAGVFP